MVESQPESLAERNKRQDGVVIPALDEKGLSFRLMHRSDAARWVHNLDRQLFYTGPGRRRAAPWALRPGLNPVRGAVSSAAG